MDEPTSPTPPPPADLQAQLDAAHAATAALRHDLAEARTAHLAMVRASNPTIPVSLITGDTPAAVDASLTAARAILAEYDAARTNGHGTARVPTGGFPPAAVDTSSMSSAEKIRHGLATRQLARKDA